MAGKFYSILDDDDIDDMVQDAWENIAGMKDRYDESKNFEGWVYRICQNFVRDTTPKFTKRRETYSSYDDYGLEDSGYCSDLADRNRPHGNGWIFYLRHGRDSRHHKR